MSSWASRVADLRKRGKTLAEIGALIGLSPSAVSDIEQGRTGAPRGEAAVLLHSLHQSLCGEAPPSITVTPKEARR